MISELNLKSRLMVRCCGIPPFNHMGLIIPVLPGPLCVYIRVHSGAAGHRAGHVPLEISQAPKSERRHRS